MVKIISDSTSDLTKELIDKLDISVIPLHILLGNDEYRDGIDITPDKIYVRNVELTGIHFIIISVIYMMCLTVFL